MFGGEGARDGIHSQSWNSVIRCALSESDSVQDRIEREKRKILKNWFILNASFRSEWLWNSVMSKYSVNIQHGTILEPKEALI